MSVLIVLIVMGNNMGWQIKPQSTQKSHRGNHKIFTCIAKAQEFLSLHKESWIVQTVFSDKEGFSEWKVYFADYEGMVA